MTDVLIAADAGVVSITLNRPAKKNALTSAMYEAMIAGLDEAARDEEIAAVLLRGSGGVFTAGNDIVDFLAAATAATDDSQPMAALAFIRRLAAYDKPVVVAIEALAIGIGATLCLHCDLVYAAPGAQFAMPFVKLGIVPEGASSLLVPRRFGARAAEMLLLGEPFSSETAAAMGLISAVVPADRLYAHAAERAGALARLPRGAMLETRKLIRGDRADILARIDEEGAGIRRMVRSDEAKAAFTNFLGRGKG